MLYSPVRIIERLTLLFFAFCGFARFLSYRTPEVANQSPKTEIFAVTIGQRASALQIQLPTLGVDKLLIHKHIDHLGQEHIVRTQRDNLPNSALYRHG